MTEFFLDKLRVLNLFAVERAIAVGFSVSLVAIAAIGSTREPFAHVAIITSGVTIFFGIHSNHCSWD